MVSAEAPPPGDAALRKIIHVDMDAFYASVEQRDQPALQGRPVVVGGSPEGRGVVAAASYEARRFGIHSAMSAAKAKRLCAELVFVRPNFEKYWAESQRLRAIFSEVTPLVEPLALDEAYLDVTQNLLGEPKAGKIAWAIKRKIKSATGLVASAGVGPNKLIAKLASDFKKPDGFWVVPPSEVDAFLLPMPVKKLWGVGPATEKRLADLNVRTVADLRLVPVEALVERLGRWGEQLHAQAFGRDERPVVSHRVAKSHGAERTFERDLLDVDRLEALVEELCARVMGEVSEGGRPGRTVTLKLRYSDFTTVTRSKSSQQPLESLEHVAQLAKSLLKETEAGRRPVRLLGVQLSGFGDDLQLRFPFDLR